MGGRVGMAQQNQQQVQADWEDFMPTANAAVVVEVPLCDVECMLDAKKLKINVQERGYYFGGSWEICGNTLDDRNEVGTNADMLRIAPRHFRCKILKTIVNHHAFCLEGNPLYILISVSLLARTMQNYGISFSDIVQGLEHVLENLSSDQILSPSSFKYRVALEKQLTSTMLHVLGLASRTDHQPARDFLVKKASFLEEWLTKLCSCMGETSTRFEGIHNPTWNQKKEVIAKAIKSLVEVYESRNHHAIALRFDKLENSMQ
ncbi:hypothetical protein RJ639_043048 [Escallonia herrerae]|uniref:Uncharacterized protein n=1 Tax=Escallonia herrerae TaxID=1293975 RepID=A0AA88WDN9_9ASTE|nr:hypothetical protein RJ639_043048 [Escallonia herrerae]